MSNITGIFLAIVTMWCSGGVFAVAYIDNKKIGYILSFISFLLSIVCIWELTR